MRRFICGVPDHACKGTNLVVNKRGMKLHNTPQEAFACHKRHLMSQGYELVGTRELKDPSNGYITLLTKPSKFGTPVRLGKHGEESGAVGDRWTYMRPGAAGDVVEIPT